MTLRVVVADDHAPTRAGVAAALERGGFAVSASVANAGAAVEAALRERPDVCLLDIRMPGSGLAAAGAITRKLPGTAVVMLTVSRDDDDLFEALRAGASGYLLKEIPSDELPAALRRVLDGEAVLPGALVARVVAEFRSRSSRRLPLPRQPAIRLTDREWDVLELMRDGLTTAEMAERLYVAPATVRTHVAAILRKLRVRDRREALELLASR